LKFKKLYTTRQTHRQTDRQTDRQTNSQDQSVGRFASLKYLCIVAVESLTEKNDIGNNEQVEDTKID